jgi:anti-sigma-K factor RskA
MTDRPGRGDHVDDNGEIEALLREIDPAELDLVAPPPDVWDGIASEIGLEPVGESAGATVVSLDRRRARFVRPLVAAAAIAVLAAGAVVVSSIRDNDDEVVATARLAFDPTAFDPIGADATAQAQLVEHEGRFEIRLADASLPDPAGNDLELWLIAARDDGTLDVQPVALVDPDDPGTYAVPAGLDPEVYSIVDISIEPRDGDVAHSGRSILRGDLADA